MNEDYILTVEEFLSPEECAKFINSFDKECTSGEDDYLNYEKYDLTFDNPNFKIIEHRLPQIVEFYKQKYPSINFTGSHWALTHLRFKKFNPGQSFENWHSEHSLRGPNRVLNIIIYLSEHDCGTQFYDGGTIKSKIGRLTIFPSYFTHTHRGQVCPDMKTRYILSGYFNFIE